jgi:hypothetical protein
MRNTQATCAGNTTISTHPASQAHDVSPVKDVNFQTGKNADLKETHDRNEHSLSEHSPENTYSEDIDVPVALSQDILFERQMDFEYFFQGDVTKKLETIETLSPQGEALSLLKEILRNEQDSNIRIAALNRLKQEHSYAATTLLIDALDDPAADVSLAALNTIVTNGDRTLLPLLKEKLASLPGGSIHNQYAQLIHQLEYSVTMEMDSSNHE